MRLPNYKISLFSNSILKPIPNLKTFKSQIFNPSVKLLTSPKLPWFKNNTFLKLIILIDNLLRLSSRKVA
jgi:hypothetical protein